MENTKYKHYRATITNNGVTVLSPKGGATAGWTYDEENLYIGVANCSQHDMFDKSVARKIVDSRIEKAKESKESSDFYAVVSLENIKNYIKSSPSIYKEQTFASFVNALTFKDLKYEFFAVVTEQIFFRK